jgi:P27 family predicted phage terminase small subunit
MARPRQPTNLILAKGTKHFTKEEIKERLSSEVQPIDDNIIAPGFLTKKQTEEFYKISDQLKKLKIMGETDVDALARYIVSRDMYENAVKQLRKKEVKSNPDLYDKWLKIQDKLFKQSRASASDLGLTISSRCKLVVPATNTETKAPTNKFAKFEKGRAVNG